jgi:hypothetical protein
MYPPDVFKPPVELCRKDVLEYLESSVPKSLMTLLRCVVSLGCSKGASVVRICDVFKMLEVFEQPMPPVVPFPGAHASNNDKGRAHMCAASSKLDLASTRVFAGISTPPLEGSTNYYAG